MQKYHECGREECETCDPMYRAIEVEAHIAALQAQHAEAIEKLNAALEKYGIRQRHCNRCKKSMATTSTATVVYCSLDCADQ